MRGISGGDATILDHLKLAELGFGRNLGQMQRAREIGVR
jgi:hypothetical protein